MIQIVDAVRAAVARYSYAVIPQAPRTPGKDATPEQRAAYESARTDHTAAIDAIFAASGAMAPAWKDSTGREFPAEPVPPPAVLGIEISDRDIAARCAVGVVGDQHGEGRLGAPGDGSGRAFYDGDWKGLSAVETAIRLGGYDTRLTVLIQRVDLDAVLAAAILALRAGFPLGEHVAAVTGEAAARIAAVAAADHFDMSKTPWAPAPLPTISAPWGDERGSIDSRRQLAAINAAVQDGSVPLATRVELAAVWLLAGEEPAGYRERVEADRLSLVAAISPETVRLAARLCDVCGHDLASDRYPLPGSGGTALVPQQGPYCGQCGGTSARALDVAIVELAHPGVTGIGYALAPVVVARVPDHVPAGSVPPAGKVTIASWGKRYDHAALAAALNAAEAAAGGLPKWGGNPVSGIIGSPPATPPTRLSLDTIVETVARAVEAHAA